MRPTGPMVLPKTEDNPTEVASWEVEHIGSRQDQEVLHFYCPYYHYHHSLVQIPEEEADSRYLNQEDPNLKYDRTVAVRRYKMLRKGFLSENILFLGIDEGYIGLPLGGGGGTP